MGIAKVKMKDPGDDKSDSVMIGQPLMNVGVVGLQEPRISVTLYTSKTYLLSATQTPT